jgi:hypothetical protein
VEFSCSTYRGADKSLARPGRKQATVGIRGGTHKFPELLKKIYSKYLYKFQTLVPFEVLPLRLDAVIQHRSQSWKHCPKSLTEMLSRVGAGITASSRRGSTSKGTKVSNLYKYFE